MKKNIMSKIINIIFILIVLCILYRLFVIYKVYNYNEFTKAEYYLGVTDFTRDNDVTYTYDYSYKIESDDYNDAIFYKTIEVEPNTPYKLTCMVKTENVEVEDLNTGCGAQISILDTTECSSSLTGTTDWQQLELIFDSKNRETVEIGFRLGGNNGNSKGTAWFTDFKLEKGEKDDTNQWNMVCFIIKNLDVEIDGEDVQISMDSSDVEKTKINMERFKTSIQDMSENKMTVNYDIYEINETLSSITYSAEYGYYIDPYDVENMLKSYLDREEYDYIFVATKLGDMEENVELPVYDWIGLRWYGFAWNRIFKYKTSK